MYSQSNLFLTFALFKKKNIYIYIYKTYRAHFLYIVMRGFWWCILTGGPQTTMEGLTRSTVFFHFIIFRGWLLPSQHRIKRARRARALCVQLKFINEWWFSMYRCPPHMALMRCSKQSHWYSTHNCLWIKCIVVFIPGASCTCVDDGRESKAEQHSLKLE